MKASGVAQSAAAELRRQEADGDHRQHMVGAADRMLEPVREAVGMGAHMRERGRREHRQSDAEQSFLHVAASSPMGVNGARGREAAQPFS